MVTKWIETVLQQSPYRVSRSRPINVEGDAKARLIWENWDAIDEKLKGKFESKIDIKTKENSRIRQRIRNIRKDKKDVYGVDLKKVVDETFNELGLPLEATWRIRGGKVTRDYFEGHTCQYSVVYNSGEKHIKQVDSKTRIKLLKKANLIKNINKNTIVIR